jgi:hypothetical protein
VTEAGAKVTLIADSKFTTTDALALASATLTTVTVTFELGIADGAE